MLEELSEKELKLQKLSSTLIEKNMHIENLETTNKDKENQIKEANKALKAIGRRNLIGRITGRWLTKQEKS